MIKGEKIVLHLLVSRFYSGAENVAWQIIRGFQRHPEYKMIYCSPDGPIRQTLLEKGVEYEPIKKATVFEVSKVIKKMKPDIIHAHDMRAGFLASISSKGIPIISHIHNNNFDSRGLSFKSLAYLYAGIKSKQIFWVSKSSYEGYFFHKFLSKKSIVLRNVIDIPALEEKAAKDTVEYDYDIVYLGRLTYPKNPQRLILVLEKVIKRMPNVKVAIIGDGDLKDEIVNMIAEKKLGDNIHYLGYKTNPYKILASSKVMVMTSRWEGLPMCSLEAMSLGIPLVATPSDGLMEIIDNGVDGILSEDDDTIVDSLVSIVESPNYQDSLSRKAKEKALKLMDIQQYISKINEAYRQC